MIAILLCAPATWTSPSAPCRLRLEDDGSGLVTLTEELVSSAEPDAKIVEVLEAVDLDRIEVRWLQDRLDHLLHHLSLTDGANDQDARRLQAVTR